MFDIIEELYVNVSIEEQLFLADRVIYGDLAGKGDYGAELLR